MEAPGEREPAQFGYAAEWRKVGWYLALGLGAYLALLVSWAMPVCQDLQQRGLPQSEAAAVTGAVWVGVGLVLPALLALPAALYRRLIGKNEYPRFLEEFVLCWGAILIVIFGFSPAWVVVQIAAHKLALALLPQMLH